MRSSCCDRHSNAMHICFVAGLRRAGSLRRYIDIDIVLLCCMTRGKIRKDNRRCVNRRRLGRAQPHGHGKTALVYLVPCEVAVYANGGAVNDGFDCVRFTKRLIDVPRPTIIMRLITAWTQRVSADHSSQLAAEETLPDFRGRSSSEPLPSVPE